MPEQQGSGHPVCEVPVAIHAWLRNGLSHRYGGVMREEIPQEMLTLAAGGSWQN